MNYRVLIAVVAAVVVGSVLAVQWHAQYRVREQAVAVTEDGANTEQLSKSSAESSSPIQTQTIPPKPVTEPKISMLDSVDLAVPFTVQAPTANWDAFHEEACEEASTIMVWHYFRKTPINSADQVETELASAAAWERANLGTDVSVPASDVVKLLHQHFGLDAAITVTSESEFKKDLNAGYLLIVPTQGQFLHNPYYKQPGPRYHMLVLRGYDSDGTFITNDSGTKHGEKYHYSYQVLQNAIHDWNGGDVENGAKVAIVVKGVLQ